MGEPPGGLTMKSLSDVPLLVLDLPPICQGGMADESFRNTLDLARHAERLGCHWFWVAEHHGLPGIASATTAVVIAHVAGGTFRIRVGSGGSCSRTTLCWSSPNSEGLERGRRPGTRDGPGKPFLLRRPI